MTTLAFVLVPSSSAFAGRLLVTGHDADLRCSGNSQCHFVQVATKYVRAGAPNPSKPVFVPDRLGREGPHVAEDRSPGRPPRA